MWIRLRLPLMLGAGGARRCHDTPIPSLPPFQIYSGGSVGGAALINSGEADVVMNWSGGMHRAKKGEASGEGRCRLVF